MAPPNKKSTIWPWVALVVGPLLLLTLVVLLVQTMGTDEDEAAPGAASGGGGGEPRAITVGADANSTAVVFEDFAQMTGQFTGFPDGKVKGSLIHLPTGGQGGAVRLTWAFTDATSTEAAYLRLDRPLGTNPRRLDVRIRAAEGQPPPRVQLKAAVKDKNGQRPLLTLFDGTLPTDWKTFTVDLPAGLTPPLVWQDVYVVRTGGGGAGYSATGGMDVDQLSVRRGIE